MRKNIVECLGTFFLVYAIGFSQEPLAIGLMLSVMVYIGGHISGAHYNPAVTIGFLIRRKIAASEAGGYVVSQLMGALLAAFAHHAVLGTSMTPTPAPGVSIGTAIFLEAVSTFALVIVIFTVATAKQLQGNFIYGFAIGLTVTALAMSVGSTCGGAFNPAVAFGPMIQDVLTGTPASSNILVYLVGPVLGGIVAPFVFNFVNNEP